MSKLLLTATFVLALLLNAVASPLPPNPTVTGAQLVCTGATTTLTASGQGGATFAWYDAATGGTLLASTAVYTTPNLTVSTHFYVQQTVSGNTSNRTDVYVQVGDTTPPVVVCRPVTLMLDATGHASLTTAQVNNGSTDNCGIASMSLNKTSYSCNDLSPTFALNFTSGNDGVTSNTTANVPTGSAARTFTAWINPSQLQQLWGFMSQGQNDCSYFMFGIGLQGSNNNLTAWGGCNDHTSNTMTVPVNTWTFVALTYDGTTNFTLYMNGASESFTNHACNT